MYDAGAFTYWGRLSSDPTVNPLFSPATAVFHLKPAAATSTARSRTGARGRSSTRDASFLPPRDSYNTADAGSSDELRLGRWRSRSRHRLSDEERRAGDRSKSRSRPPITNSRRRRPLRLRALPRSRCRRSAAIGPRAPPLTFERIRQLTVAHLVERTNRRALARDRRQRRHPDFPGRNSRRERNRLEAAQGQNSRALLQLGFDRVSRRQVRGARHRVGCAVEPAGSGADRVAGERSVSDRQLGSRDHRTCAALFLERKSRSGFTRKTR